MSTGDPINPTTVPSDLEATSWRQPLRRLLTAFLAVVVAATLGLAITPAADADDEVGSISGRVTDTEGNGLSDIPVGVWAAEDPPWPAGSTFTDEDGYFSIGNLATYHGYFVAFNNASRLSWANRYWNGTSAGATTLTSATEIAVTGGSTVTGIDGTLPASSTVSGTVTGDGAPLQDVRVEATMLNPEVAGWLNATFYAYPDENGDYTLNLSQDGSYRIMFNPTAGDWVAQYWDGVTSADDATAISTVAPGAATGIDADLTTGSGGTPDPITNNTPPVITGTPQVGSTLTTTPGTWTPTDVTLSYQWYAGTNPVGTNTTTYTPTTTDIDQPITVHVTATKNGHEDTTAISAPTDPVQAAPSPPRMSAKCKRAATTLVRAKAAFRLARANVTALQRQVATLRKAIRATKRTKAKTFTGKKVKQRTLRQLQRQLHKTQVQLRHAKKKAHQAKVTLQKARRAVANC